MKPTKRLVPLAMALATLPAAHADQVFNLEMQLNGTAVTEQVTKNTFTAHDRVKPMQIKGRNDNYAWRTDGWTSWMEGQTGNVIDGNTMSAEVQFAIDTNVILTQDEASGDNQLARFVDCINGNTGFAFLLGRRGQYGFEVYVGGQKVGIYSDKNSDEGKLQLWEWQNLTGVVDGNQVKLYLNNKLVGQATASGTGVKVNGTMTLGRDKTNNATAFGQWRIADFNGAIDHVRINNTQNWPNVSPVYADLNLPADRYESDKLRPVFHGQPGMNWTNESHGLLYNPADGNWHVTFQRTGSIPGMQHAHHGHIVSSDLFNWKDDKPMIWPSEEYDKRGCWSGCLFTDSKINGGKPVIIYTGVEYGETSHAAWAFCDDAANLRKWHKSSLGNPLSTYGNVARDTYFFRVDDNNAYFIIGDSGHMKSYKYNQASNSWSENGHFYDFQAGESGFTEMPNVTKLPNGKWLMTYTPFTGNVQAIYRIGDIDAQGKFVNFNQSQLFDCFAKDGFALMSPSIGKDQSGNLVALGIVADKMGGDFNTQVGYAHAFSLPRSLGVDAAGNLTQAPFRGYEKMHGNVSYVISTPQTLDGAKALNPVRGRQADACAVFTVGDYPFGINFLTNPKGKGGKITYNPANHTVTIDVAAIVGDGYGMKNNSYTLPVYPVKGEDMKLQVFIDHSMVDVFINDRYASSFRVFPSNMDYDLIQVFSNGPTLLKRVDAYLIGEGDMRSEPIEPKEFTLPENSGKVAFIKSAASVSNQENAALSFFTSKLKGAGAASLAGNVITTSETGRIRKADFDALWIHIDRKGLAKGASNLPSEFISAEMTAALKKFLADGGNIYLSGQATQMAVTLGRLASKFAPNEFNSGDGTSNSDEWTVNPKQAGKYDRSDHAIYKDLETSEAYAWTTYGLLGGNNLHRDDHNCMWKLTDFTFSSTATDRVKQFEEDNLACALGTWGQENAGEFVGIFEFYPVKGDNDTWSGSVIANGLAACQWDAQGNLCEQNLQLLTANVFSYLANKNGVKPYNPEGSYSGEDPEDPEIPSGEITDLESTGKVALWLGYASQDALNTENHRQDKAIYEFFTQTFTEGQVLWTGDANKISTDNYDCIWVHCDKQGVDRGVNNLPEGFRSQEFINALKAYSEAGGNLYLSKQAGQLVNAIGRTSHEPTEYSNGGGGQNGDDWTINIAHHNGVDWSGHLMFSGVEVRDVDYGKLVVVNSGQNHREDHNCMWKLNDFGGHDNFCTVNNARVLGTWGHNGGQDWGGIIEFLPNRSANAPMHASSISAVEARKGTVITNGVAAFEFAPQSGTNTSDATMKALTSNMLHYLSPLGSVTVGVGNIGETEPEAEDIYFTLQGMRTANPAAGIYIRVRAGKAVKVLIP